MALCSKCGGVDDPYPLPGPMAKPPIEVDPYCPHCGQPRHRTCTRCGGSGCIDAAASVRLIREYCTRCGEPIEQTARAHCPDCGGTGRLGHFCSGWAWYARAHGQQSHVRGMVAVSAETAIALRAKRSRVLVKSGS